MPQGQEKSKSKDKMFNEIDVENTTEQPKQESHKNYDYFFGDSRFESAPVNKNQNNQWECERFQSFRNRGVVFMMRSHAKDHYAEQYNQR